MDGDASGCAGAPEIQLGSLYSALPEAPTAGASSAAIRTRASSIPERASARWRALPFVALARTFPGTRLARQPGPARSQRAGARPTGDILREGPAIRRVCW